MKLTIHLANKDDVHDIAVIGRETHRETFPNIKDEAAILDFRFGDRFLTETYFSELASGKVTYFLIKDDNKIVGYAKLVLENQQARLDKIYLLQAYQRMNIGSTLIHECFRQALAKDINVMTLVVNRNNSARAFYEKHGFFGTGVYSTAIPGTTELTDELMRCDDLNKHLRQRAKL
jgi:ribosomal protein S18 acetylase RimI-like enzyme